MARGRSSGFTLLEVLIAFAILAVAVVSLIELTSQGLRLLKVSGDHQQAVLIADRIARDTQVIVDDVKADAPTDATTVETGEEGRFTWERRIERVTLPEEFEPKRTLPGKEMLGLYAISVAVRWAPDHSVQVATLRSPTSPAASGGATSATDQQGQPGQQGPGQAVDTPETSRTTRTRLPGSGSGPGSGTGTTTRPETKR